MYNSMHADRSVVGMNNLREYLFYLLETGLTL